MTKQQIEKEITDVMELIQSIDFYDLHTWKTKHMNQSAINRAYKKLFNLKEKLNKEEGGTNDR